MEISEEDNNINNNNNKVIYVALGNDLQDGFKTLEWTLKKWNSQQISIIILHLTSNISMDFVYTPLGKIPAAAISDEKLEVLKNYEKEKIDMLLSNYLSFCGQVKVELLKVEKCDYEIHKVMIDMISGHRITKLVMGISFLKSSSWKLKNAISGSFYVHKNKPDFCELFIICGGKQFSIRSSGENNKLGIMEDDQGVLVAKLREKPRFKDWLGKIFVPNPNLAMNHNRRILSSSASLPASIGLDSPSTQNHWENNALRRREIEEYFQHLLSLNLDEQEKQLLLCFQSFQPSLMLLEDHHLTEAEKIESLKRKLKEAQRIIQSNRFESKENAERRAKAERAILICDRWVEELQARIREEITIRTELSNNLDSKKGHLEEIATEIEETESKLNLLVGLKTELSKKLRVSTLAKAHSEAQLEGAVSARLSIARENEELRKQRDVLRRRIEFCREKDNIVGAAVKFAELSYGFKEFSTEQIRLATNGFSERLRLKPGGSWTMVYRGRINHSMVAIKMFDSTNGHSQQDFLAKVQLLSQIKHPHLVSIMGFCGNLKCIVFEYMHNGSLRDIFLRDILYAKKNSGKRIRTLRWHDRVRVAAEICSGLGFLHTAKPKPIVHGHLRLSSILLDRNLVAKISGFGLGRSGGDEHNIRSDIRAFGVLLMHLLTGRNWSGLVEAMNMDRSALVRDMDEMAGKWPKDLAERLADLALRCLSSNRGPNTDLRLDVVMEELNDLREKAANLVAKGEYKMAMDRRSDMSAEHTFDQDDIVDVPTCFLCPIFQEVMKNPHVASDGFSYELEAIEEWLRMGNDTSPMTNLRLKHTFLTPNHALRTLIQDWHNKRSIPLP